jgi:hypothetical protein
VWNKIYASYLWQKIRFPEGTVYEDLDTTYKIFDEATGTVVLDEPLVLYRKRLDSITATLSFIHIRDRNNASARYEAFNHSSNLFSDEQIRCIRQNRTFGLFSRYLKFIQSYPEEKEAARNIRAMILELGQGISFNRCDKTVRMRLFLLRFMPWILPALRPCYRLLRVVKEKAFGR